MPTSPGAIRLFPCPRRLCRIASPCPVAPPLLFWLPSSRNRALSSKRQESGHRVASVSVNWSRCRAFGHEDALRPWRNHPDARRKDIGGRVHASGRRVAGGLWITGGKAICSLRVVRTRRLPRPHTTKGKRGFRTLRSRTLCSARLTASEPRDELFHTQEENPLLVIIISCRENLRLGRGYGCTGGTY